MFDFALCRPFDASSPEKLDSDLLACVLARLSDDELATLEDELDFCAFTGVPSLRILKLLREMTDLDAGWNAQLEAEADPDLPEADFSGQRPAVKRGNRNARGFEPLANCA